MEDGVGGAVDGAWGTQAATDFGEVGAHGVAERRRAEEGEDLVGDAVGGEVGLDEFGEGAGVEAGLMGSGTTRFSAMRLTMLKNFVRTRGLARSAVRGVTR